MSISRRKKAGFLRLLVRGVGPALIGAAQQIVRAGLVKVRQLDEHIRGDVPLAHFIVRIADLGTLQIRRQILLIQVPVLPQIADTSIHLCRPL